MVHIPVVTIETVGEALSRGCSHLLVLSSDPPCMCPIKKSKGGCLAGAAKKCEESQQTYISYTHALSADNGTARVVQL